MIEEQITKFEIKFKEKLAVDLLNILYEDRDEEGKLKVENVKKVYNYLLKENYEPFLIVDASAKYQMDDENEYEFLVNAKVVIQAPAGRKADIFILKIAKTFKCKFLTNDLYKDYYEEYGKDWIIKSRKTCMFIDGQLILE